jgi:hypothetical protein
LLFCSLSLQVVDLGYCSKLGINKLDDGLTYIQDVYVSGKLGS